MKYKINDFVYVNGKKAIVVSTKDTHVEGVDLLMKIGNDFEKKLAFHGAYDYLVLFIDENSLTHLGSLDFFDESQINPT